MTRYKYIIRCSTTNCPFKQVSYYNSYIVETFINVQTGIQCWNNVVIPLFGRNQFAITLLDHCVFPPYNCTFTLSHKLQPENTQRWRYRFLTFYVALRRHKNVALYNQNCMTQDEDGSAEQCTRKHCLMSGNEACVHKGRLACV